MTLHIGKRQPPHSFRYFEIRDLDISRFAKYNDFDKLFFLEKKKYRPLEGDDKLTHENYIANEKSGLVDFYTLWDLAHTLIYLFENKYFYELNLCLSYKNQEALLDTRDFKEEILERNPFRIKSIADKADLILSDTLPEEYPKEIYQIYFSVISSAQNFKNSLRKHKPYDADKNIDPLLWRDRDLFQLFIKNNFLRADISNEDILEILNSYFDTLEVQIRELLRIFKMRKGNYVNKEVKTQRQKKTMKERESGKDILLNKFIDYIKSMNLKESDKFRSIDDFFDDFTHYSELTKILEEYQHKMTDKNVKILNYGKEIKSENLPKLFKKWRDYDLFSEALSKIMKDQSISQNS